MKQLLAEMVNNRSRGILAGNQTKSSDEILVYLLISQWCNSINRKKTICRNTLDKLSRSASVLLTSKVEKLTTNKLTFLSITEMV
jgi:hypothetical protein